MVLLANNIFSSMKSLTTLGESSILDVSNGSEYASIVDSFLKKWPYLFLYLNHYLVICYKISMSIVFLEKDGSVNKPVFYMSNAFRLFPIICMSLKRLNLLCLTKKDILVTFSYFRQFLANLDCISILLSQIVTKLYH